MKKILFGFLFSVILFGCNNDLKKYYPYGTCYTQNGDRKSFHPGNEIYIDNSKINDFELYMVYNTLDTVSCVNSFIVGKKDKKIFIIDTLKFNVTKGGVKSLNNKYLKEYDFPFTKRGISQYLKNMIRVPNGNDIEVILKKDEKIIESYITDFNKRNESGESIDFQYIINPLSKSRFQVDTLQYGGYDEFKSKRFSKNFIEIKGEKINFFLIPPPDYLRCQYGCIKTVLRQVK